MLCCAFQLSRSCVAETISRTPARGVMLVLYVSATRRGAVGGLSWFCGARLFARVRVLAVLDTSAVGRLGTPICTNPREIPARHLGLAAVRH